VFGGIEVLSAHLDQHQLLPEYGGDASSAVCIAEWIDQTLELGPVAALAPSASPSTCERTVDALEQHSADSSTSWPPIDDASGGALGTIPASPVPETHTQTQPSTFGLWLLRYLCITVFVLAASVCYWLEAAIISPSSAIGQMHVVLLIGGVCLIPYFALSSDLKSRFDSMIFHYTEGQASSLVYYRNCFAVALRAPLLAVNWFTLRALSSSSNHKYDDQGLEQNEIKESSVVLSVAVAALLAFFIYFTLIDRNNGDTKSAARLVDHTEEKWRGCAVSSREDSEAPDRTGAEELGTRGVIGVAGDVTRGAPN